jgi:hypothetical protein
MPVRIETMRFWYALAVGFLILLSPPHAAAKATFVATQVPITYRLSFDFYFGASIGGGSGEKQLTGELVLTFHGSSVELTFTQHAWYEQWHFEYGKRVEEDRVQARWKGRLQDPSDKSLRRMVFAPPEVSGSHRGSGFWGPVPIRGMTLTCGLAQLTTHRRQAEVYTRSSVPTRILSCGFQKGLPPVFDELVNELLEMRILALPLGVGHDVHVHVYAREWEPVVRVLVGRSS